MVIVPNSLRCAATVTALPATSRVAARMRTTERQDGMVLSREKVRAGFAFEMPLAHAVNARFFSHERPRRSATASVQEDAS
jgi:hypothetical protein